MNKPIISASILSADFARLGEDCEKMLTAGVDWLHLDVMDNHFVPNLTFGSAVCSALKSHGIKATLDVHLMVEPVDPLIEAFAKAGADYITVHAEATKHLDRSLQLIRESGCKAGIALNPHTPLDCLEYVLAKTDLVLLMSVNPGFGGQKFIQSVLSKISNMRQILNDKGLNDVRLSVDGGVKLDNCQDICNSGADTLVIGSALFNEKNYAKTVEAFRSKLS